MRVLGIDIGADLALRWSSWFAPSSQPFFVTDDLTLVLSPFLSGRDYSWELADTFGLQRDGNAERPLAWMDESQFQGLDPDVRSRLVRDQVELGRLLVPTVRRWRQEVGPELAHQVDGHRFVWWPSLLEGRAATVIGDSVAGKLPSSRHDELSERDWASISARFPGAREIAGRFPAGSGPDGLGAVMAATGAIETVDDPVAPEAFDCWLDERAAPFRRGAEEPGTLLVWRHDAGAVSNAALTIADGLALFKPTSSWMSPYLVWSVDDVKRIQRTPGLRLHRYTLATGSEAGPMGSRPERAALPSLPGVDPSPAPIEHRRDDAPAITGVPVLPDAPPAWETTPAAVHDDVVVSVDPVDAGPIDPERPMIDAWDPYREPSLVGIRTARRALIVGRVLPLLWALALVIVTSIERSEALDGATTGSTATRIGLLGVPVVVAVIAAGLWWSERSVTNLHRLEARLPPMWRVFTAWLSPAVWAGLLAITVLQLAPNDELDVRPAVVGGVFVAAMWRPFALIRRVVKSAIPVPSDELIALAFVLDVAGFGLLWWQLWTFSGNITAVDTRDADSLVGLSAAAAFAFAAAVPVWVLITREVGGALEFRRVSRRTRHDHSQLRRRGIDPLDPAVRRALLDARRELDAVADPLQVEQRADGASSLVDPDDDLSSTVARTPVVLDAEPVEAGTPDASIVADGEPSVGELDADDTRRIVRATTPDPLADLARRAEEITEEPTAGVEDVDVDVAAAFGAVRDDDDSDDVSPLDRLEHRIDDVDDPTGEVTPARRIADRLATDPDSGDREGDWIMRRLAEHGMMPGDGPIAEPDTTFVGQHADQEGPAIVDRIYRLEAARYAVLILMLGAAMAAGWLVVRAVSITELVDGDIAAGDAEAVDEARRAFVTLLGLALGSVPVWVAVAGRVARRAEATVVGHARCLVFAAVAVAANVVAFVVDRAERSGVTATVVVLCLGLTVLSIPTLLSIQRWFDRSTSTTTVWPTALVMGVVVAWTAGFHRPIGPGSALESISFFGALAAISVAAATVIAAVSAAGLEEALRLSPAFRARGRGGPVDDGRARPE